MLDDPRLPLPDQSLDPVFGDSVTPDCAAVLSTVADWTWRTDESGHLVSLSPGIAKITKRPSAAYRGFQFSAWGTFLRPDVIDLTESAAFRERIPFTDVLFSFSDTGGTERVFMLSGVPVFGSSNGQFQGFSGMARESAAPVPTRAETAANPEANPVAEPMAVPIVDPLADPTPLQSVPQSETAPEMIALQQISLLSRDIRDPLNAMLGFMELICDAMRSMAETRPLTRYCDHVFAAAEEMLDRLDDTLDLAQLQHGETALDLQPFDLAEQAAYCLGLIAPFARRKAVEVRQIGTERPLEVVADKHAVRRILIAFLGNALHDTNAGDRITLDLRTEGRFARVEVRDTGAGMEPECLARLVAPFDTGNRVDVRMAPRTEWGIAISRLLLDAHGGTLTLSSEPGQGTAACALLPLQPAKGH